MKDINEIKAYDYGYGFLEDKLSWRKEIRMRDLETELKDVLVEMTAVKGVEEALKRMEDN